MSQKRCLRKHCVFSVQIILIRQAPSCRERNLNKWLCFPLCLLFFDWIRGEAGREGRGEDGGGLPALLHLIDIPAARQKCPGRALPPPGTLQKEFAAFPWVEIMFVASLSWVKKKVSEERNPDAIGCKVTVSQREGGILPPPPPPWQIINNCRGRHFLPPRMGPGWCSVLDQLDKWSVSVWQLLFSCENRDFMVQDQFCQIKSKCNNHWAIAIWYLNTPTSLILLLILKKTPLRSRIFLPPPPSQRKE